MTSRIEYDDEWGSQKLPKNLGKKQRFNKKQLLNYIDDLEYEEDEDEEDSFYYR
tara:strand:+ start:3268 stop:3429 length:162 start_codon:yes stop_codon:yes gene_type:complete